jgi:hypothetical protein
MGEVLTGWILIVLGVLWAARFVKRDPVRGVALISWTLVAWVFIALLLVIDGQSSRHPPAPVGAIMALALVPSAVFAAGAAALAAGQRLGGGVLLGAVLMLMAWVSLGSTLSCTGCASGPSVMIDAVDGSRHAMPGFPHSGADAWDYWHAARETCAQHGVALLARSFGTQPTAESVAGGYSRWMRADALYGRTSDETKLGAVHAGCLQGFRDART